MEKILGLNNGYKIGVKTIVIAVFFIICFVQAGLSQTSVLYSTDFGAGTTFPAGWSNSGSPAWVVANTGSSDYIGASGSSQARSGNGTGTATLTLDNNISTIGYTNITVLWGARRTVTQGVVSFQWSSDGVTWNNVSFADVLNDVVWNYVNSGVRISLPSAAEGVSNLRFRWSLVNPVSYRIDDFSVIATSTNTISVVSLSSSNFTLANCSATVSASLNFASTGTFNTGNTYTVQLSDAMGSFSLPAIIGTLTSNTNSGAVNFTIPAGLVTGTGYFVRVVSDNPSVISSSSSISVTQNGICSSSSTDYFRSRQSGNWNTASTWESSADNTTWITATQPPTSIANVITIRNGHTVTIDAAASADQLTIETGGILNHSDNITFTLDDGVGTDMNIFGTYIIYGPVPAGTGTYVVESGGIIQANGNNGGTADNIAWSSNGRVQFKSGSIFNWNTNLAFNTGGITFFPDNSEKPIFRISSAMGLIGGGANTIINGLLEVNGSVTWGSAGTKTFRDGIIGTGSLIQDNTSGAFIINGTSAQLGGTGTITLATNGLQIASGAIVSLISNKTINGPGNSITVNNGGTLNCSANNLSGSANFVLSSGGILGIGSADGITSSSALGNIQTNGRTFNSGAVYIYNGNTNQSTGNFSTTPLAGTVHSLVIANTGGNGNNTVTLTNNNTVTDLLYLNTGLFASGLNQTLKIANNGSVYGHGGGNPNNATAGNIEFVGNGSTNGLADGNPSLYSVIINGGVDFNGATTHAAAIMNQLQLKAGAYVADAPFYNSGSSLVYSTGGTYGRNVEWGNSVGLPGYPYNVTVGANTILDLNTNPVAGAQLETGGNLSIGNSTGWGRVYMNNSMAKPLSVGGNLIIGSVDAASASSELGLSNSIGGDLWLYGNFSRYDGSSYTDNDRAIFFKGTANASINTPNVAITPAIPTQYFSYAVVDKSAGSEVITLNCPVGINKLITFNNGIITSTASHPLVVVDNANATGASTFSFVNGPVRKIGDDNFSFPVGKIVFTTPHYRAIGISGLSSSTTFTAEFIRANSRLLGAVNTSPVQWVSQCEYWNLDRNAGSSSANVTLSWSAQSPCNVAANSYINDLGSLVVVHFNTSTLTWDSHGNNGGYSGDNTTGSVTWNNVSAFSPFALGTTDVRYNPLPQVLNLVSFSAVSRKSDVLIDWSLMSNNDQEEFILEHSRDGVNFEKIKVVPTKVILNLATYSEVDSDPWYGWNYYRLHVTDKQNREKVSNIIKVWYGANELVRVLPNPASEKIVINFSDPRSISRIELVNISGQILKQVNTVQFSTEINISQLQAGMYYLRILDKNGLITKPFVKK